MTDTPKSSHRNPLKEALSFLEERPRVGYWLLAGLVSLAPLLLAIFLHAMLNTGVSYFRTVPANVDELLYYAQIKAVIEHGAPLGYFGVSGTHAAVGAFGPWGIAPLLPYALLGKLFGFTYYSMCIMNALFVTLANLAFILLARPDKKQLALFAVAELISYNLIWYLGSSMTMPLRYSIAVVFAGLFARLYLYETGRLFRYVAAPVAVVFGTFIYYPFAALIPPLIVARAKTKKSLVKRAALSIPITLAAAGAVILSDRYTTAPYYLSGDEAADFVAEMAAHPLAALPLAFRRLLKKAALINPFNSVFNPNYAARPDAPFSLFYICLLAVVFISLIFALFSEKPRNDRRSVFSVYALYSICAMSAGFLLFNRYSSYPHLIKETSLALLAAFCALALSGDKKLLKRFAIISLVGIVPFWTATYYPSYTMQYFASKDDVAYFDTRAATYAQYLEVDPLADRWENTVSLDTVNWRPLLWTPAGLGFNTFASDPRSDTLPDAKYILACDDAECASCKHDDGVSRADMYIEAGYTLLYKDTDTQNAIILNPKYDR